MAIVGLRIGCVVILTIIAIYASGLFLVRGAAFLIAGRHQFPYWMMAFGGLAALILFVTLFVGLLYFAPKAGTSSGRHRSGPPPKPLTPYEEEYAKRMSE